eukprot:m.368216 g.368216  ORF g.368216 m.368216 type:complete len:59 (+) comp28109_c1_seq8:497-673(+)
MWGAEHAALPLVGTAMMSLRGGVQMYKHYNPSRVRLCCASTTPWSAARRNNRAASAWS